MKRQHWITLALFLSGLAGMVGTLDHWSDAIRTQFFAGILSLGASVINAAFGETPIGGNPVTKVMVDTTQTVVNKLAGVD